ncbi:hypothetical protein HN51_055338 [Arachis hypogaea]|uniref:(S)-ureidoglycine aminohydrolase cupin domain-containing protein n=1 Tax=Arachis hypogaea TaxID=3818 RepID=A0A444XPC5_ARAHY|nr:uncharacterized protein LOC112776635 isoform X1 [Arachis hypogaea]QHN78028.1 uncharacterized protein DS421_19g657920 [Arachis hypogaea]RYQ91590.1 hypothetical protein Ahy_B09g097548 [Arachis hypogaea]
MASSSSSSYIVATLSPNNSLLFSQTRLTGANWVHFPSTSRRRVGRVRAETESMATVTEKLGIKVERNPPETKLTELGVKQWPKWGCPPSKFPWTYEAKETCYLLEGKVKVTPSGADESVEIGAGDLVVFPKGMSCTWDVSVGVDKHYKFE